MGVGRRHIDIEKKTSTTASHRHASNKCKWQAKNIRKPAENDVLCGRGGKGNFHKGNARFRQLVWKCMDDYSMCSTKAEKTELSLKILDQWEGRFLEFNKETGTWNSVPKGTARRKVSQRLRDNKEKNEKRIASQLQNPKATPSHNTENNTSRRITPPQEASQLQNPKATPSHAVGNNTSRRITPSQENFYSKDHDEQEEEEEASVLVPSSLKQEDDGMTQRTDNEDSVDMVVSSDATATTTTTEFQQDDSTTTSVAVDSENWFSEDECNYNDRGRTFSESMDLLFEVAQQEGEEHVYEILGSRNYEQAGRRGTLSSAVSWDDSCSSWSQQSSLQSSVSNFDDDHLLLTPVDHHQQQHHHHHVGKTAELETTQQMDYNHSYSTDHHAPAAATLSYQQNEHHQERQERNHLDDRIALDCFEDDKDLEDSFLHCFFEQTTL